jgi:hypothetical protein
MTTDGDETNKSDNNASMSENKIKHWLDAYDRVYKHYEIVGDHYFKRTQILMIAIQIVLITSFGKLVSDITTLSPLSTQKLVLLLSIPVIGLFFAFAWISFINRQCDTLEFCRCYMRYIEKKLLNNVPLAYFRAESVIFYHHCSINFIGGPNNGNSSDSDVGDNSEDKFCLQTKFPYDRKETKILGVVGIEKDMVRFILLIWIACFTAILSMHWNILPCLLPYIFHIFIVISILVFAYWIVLRNLWKKLNLWGKLEEYYRNRKRKLNIYRKENKEINFWDLKKDDF